MFPLGLPKIKIFWNIGYDVVISVHDVRNTFLSLDSIYIAYLVKWLVFAADFSLFSCVSVRLTSS